MLDTLVLCAASLLAGALDAIVGGGGLVLTPALFSVFPTAPPATLFGTNKAAAVWGTAWATGRYARRVTLPWATLWPAALAAAAGSFAGARAVSMLPGDALRRALPFVLLALLVYTVAKKDLGHHHAPRWQGRGEIVRAVALSLAVGFYDGGFGPGTGSFFVFLFVRGLGYDFLHASACAKLLNTATNLAALAWFASTGHVWWHLALPMAAANVAGSLIGTRVALARGTGFVRIMFIVVVGALVLKTAWDAFLR